MNQLSLAAVNSLLHVEQAEEELVEAGATLFIVRGETKSRKKK